MSRLRYCIDMDKPFIFSGMANRITEAATMEVATTKAGGH